MAVKRRSTKELPETDNKRGRRIDIDILPLDIAFDILLRLPVKALLRLRCVSKSWNKLSRDPVFINRHKEHNRGKEKLLLKDKNRCRYSLDYQGSGKLIPIARPQFATPERYFHDAHIVGYCDGLFCVEYLKPTSKRLYLWNPSTTECRIIPCLRTPSKYEGESNGFYYNPNTNDYEILSIIRRPALIYRSKVAIYSLCQNSWRALPGIPYEIQGTRWSGGKLLNGFIHWASRAYNQQKHSIRLIAFEIGGEKFSEVPRPDIHLTDCYEILVTDYRQKLCIIHAKGMIWDFWVMNEYGVMESWTKFYEIGVTESWQYEIREPPGHIRFGVMFPFCLTKNGLVLMRKEKDYLVLENADDKCNQCLHRVPCAIVEAHSYSESLVDLKSFRRRRVSRCQRE